MQVTLAASRAAGAARREGVSVSLASPDAAVVRAPGTTLIAWGVNVQDLQPLHHTARPSGEMESALCKQRGDAAILKVRHRENVPIAVEA